MGNHSESGKSINNPNINFFTIFLDIFPVYIDILVIFIKGKYNKNVFNEQHTFVLVFRHDAELVHISSCRKQ
jgi:hypothetical protein